MVKLASVSSMWRGSGWPSRVRGAASPSSLSSSQASPVWVENRISCPTVTKRKEDYVQPWLRKMVGKNAYGVYFVFKSMEQGPSFRVTVPKFPTKDPNHRILARQKSRFTHDYFYIRDE